MLLGLNQTNCYTTFTSGKRKKTPNNNSKKSVVSEAWNPYTYEFCKCRRIIETDAAIFFINREIIFGGA